MRSRFAVLALSLAFLLPAFAVEVAAEDPYNQDCEGLVVVILLCAGADAGTNGGCENEDNTRPDVACWYTYGWNVNASSPAQLPGGGTLNWTYEVHYCIDGEDCVTLAAGGGQIECVWALNEVEPCFESDMGGGELDVVLALGECVVVTATVTVWAESWAVQQESPLFAAAAADDSEGGAAACFLDNGRE